MKKEKIFVRCLMKDSLPYKIIKSIKPNYRIKFLELKEKLGLPEAKLRNTIYFLTNYISENEDFIEINKNYDFVIAGDRKTINAIRLECRKYNEKLQKNAWSRGALQELGDRDKLT